MQEGFHIPVMLTEVLDYLNLKQGDIIVDATTGTGGHTFKILERILPRGRLIGIDKDLESLAVAKERLRNFSGSCDGWNYAGFFAACSNTDRHHSSKILGYCSYCWNSWFKC